MVTRGKAKGVKDFVFFTFFRSRRGGAKGNAEFWRVEKEICEGVYVFSSNWICFSDFEFVDFEINFGIVVYLKF